MRVQTTLEKCAPGMDLFFVLVARRRKKPWKGKEHQVF
jgi:hypothetical protein